jgi:hypothetical protein
MRPLQKGMDFGIQNSIFDFLEKNQNSWNPTLENLKNEKCRETVVLQNFGI